MQCCRLWARTAQNYPKESSKRPSTGLRRFRFSTVTCWRRPTFSLTHLQRLEYAQLPQRSMLRLRIFLKRVCRATAVHSRGARPRSGIGDHLSLHTAVHESHCEFLLLSVGEQLAVELQLSFLRIELLEPGWLATDRRRLLERERVARCGSLLHLCAEFEMVKDT